MKKGIENAVCLCVFRIEVLYNLLITTQGLGKLERIGIAILCKQREILGVLLVA